LEDLLYIAVYIFGADTTVSRGTKKDVFAERWRRHFSMVLPVSDISFWSSPSIQDKLVDMLSWLTGDMFTFTFVPRSASTERQQMIELRDVEDTLSKGDAVVMFSGGLDSLAAVLEVLSAGHYPVLVSHRPAAVISKRQTNLVDCLRKTHQDWVFPHVNMWVNHSGKRPADHNQRSRSFLFTCLGAVVAKLLGVNEVRLCDNGVVSINLPQSPQNVATLLSRSTHPKYLRQVQDFLREVCDSPELAITNTLALKTKREVVELISECGHPELIQEAVSCSHTEGQTKLHRHCGVCSQCIDRRFATMGAGLEKYDLQERYKKNIFIDALSEGEERARVDEYLRFAENLRSLVDAEDLFSEYPELIDCIPRDEDVVEYGESISRMLQKHQESVWQVVRQQLKSNVDLACSVGLHNGCLLDMVFCSEYRRDPKGVYAERLRLLLCTGLPPAFQTEGARNERSVQDVGESILVAARENMQRETPQMPFAGINTKPDFSNLSNLGQAYRRLFVEFKYPKDRKRLNSVVTEMTSRVTIYRDQGACVLFIVYDPARAIVNDEAFIGDFEKHKNVWVGIAR